MSPQYLRVAIESENALLLMPTRVCRRLDTLQFRVAMEIALFHTVAGEGRGWLPFWD